MEDKKFQASVRLAPYDDEPIKEDANGLYYWATADDESPSCARCAYFCDIDEECSKSCGPGHGWNRYARKVYIREAEGQGGKRP